MSFSLLKVTDNGAMQQFSRVRLDTRLPLRKKTQLEMWANAQRDGRPAKHRWRPLFNAAKFG